VLVDNIEVRRPSLDDVFFALTGGHIAEDGLEDDPTVAHALDAVGSGREVTGAGA
jgi:hypothetical protein